LIGGGMALLGVSLTLFFTNRGRAADKSHERAMRKEGWAHEAALAEIARRREVYEDLSASVDAVEHAVSLIYSARQSGKDPAANPDLSRFVMDASAQMFKARSRLKLYGSQEAIDTGLTLSAHALDLVSAARDYTDWQKGTLGFREAYADSVRRDLTTEPAGVRRGL
jgi:hypothetical protein